MQEIPDNRAPLFRVIIAFTIVYIVWGSTYFFVEVADKELPPFVIGALRFSISGLLLMGWCAMRGYKLFDRAQLKPAFITGNLLLFIGNGSIIWAEKTVPSSLAAVLVSAGPLWFVLFDKRNLKSNLKDKFILIGIFTGLAGVVLLFSEKIFYRISPSANIAVMIIPMLIIVAGNISWSVGALYSKYNSKGNTIVGIAWQMIFGGFSFLAVACFTGKIFHFPFHEVGIRVWLSIAFLIFMGSLAGYIAYMWLLQVRPATQVSTNAYVNPLVAVLLGVLFGGETVSSLQMSGLAIILFSVFIINFEKYKGKLK